MRYRTLTLLLLVLEEIIAATIAAPGPSSSRRYNLSDLVARFRTSRLENCCRNSSSSGHFVELSLARAPATSTFTTFFPCDFSTSASFILAASTSTSTWQRQQWQMLHASIFPSFFACCSAAATPQQHPHTLSYTSGDVALKSVTVRRSTALKLRFQDECAQRRFLPALWCSTLLCRGTAISALHARRRDTEGVTNAAAVGMSGRSSCLLGTPKLEASLIVLLAPAGNRSTCSHKRGDTLSAATVINFCGSPGLATISYPASKTRSAASVALPLLRRTKSDTHLSSVAPQRLTQQKGYLFFNIPPSSTSQSFSVGALRLSGKLALEHGLLRAVQDSMSFVCSVRPWRVVNEIFSSFNTCCGSNALLPKCSRGVCSKNGSYSTFLKIRSSPRASGCGPDSIGRPTICSASPCSSRILKRQAWNIRGSRGTTIFRVKSTINSRCCNSESSGSVGSYICLTSPEAARVFSSCWRRACCPALLPRMLVCIGAGTRAAAEDSLLMEFELYVRQHQRTLKDQVPRRLSQRHEEQRHDDQQKGHHVPGEEDSAEADQVQPHPRQRDIAGDYIPLTQGHGFARDFAGHVLLPGSSVVSTFPFSTSATTGPYFPAPSSLSHLASGAQSASTVVPVNTEGSLSAEAAVAQERSSRNQDRPHEDSVDVDVCCGENAAATETRAEAERRAPGGVKEVAILRTRCDHIPLKAGRSDVPVKTNDSVVNKLYQSFFPMKPSSASAASLAAELPPRPPLLHYLQAAVCTFFGQQSTSKKTNPGCDEVERVIECISTAIECRSLHAHTGCKYTPEEAVDCVVKLLHQDDSRELKRVLLQRCCPCWLQTRALWPASALARPTLQDVLQQRPLQVLRQYCFAADPSPVRLQMDVLSVEHSHANENKTTKNPGDVRASGGSRAAAIESLSETTTGMPLVQNRPYAPAPMLVAEDNGASEHGVVLQKSSAGSPPAQNSDIPRACRLFAIERYNTYTTTQVMLTAAERHTLLQCMQEVLCCTEGHSSNENSDHTPSERNGRDNGDVTDSPYSLPDTEGRKRTSGALSKRTWGVETTKGTTDGDMSRDLALGLCNADTVRGSAVAPSVNAESRASGMMEATDVTRADDANDNSSENVDGDGDCEEPRQSSKDRREAKDSVWNEVCTCKRLVIVILASPSAVWGWTANGLPTSAAACCVERPLPSYTAIHASTKDERHLSKHQLARMQMQQPCSMDAGSDATNCSKTGGCHLSCCDVRNSQGTNGSKMGTVVPTINITAGERTDASRNNRAHLSDGKSSKLANLRDIRKKCGTARGTKGRDAAFFEAAKFVQLLQNCHQVLQDGRKQREQEQQDEQRRRFVALCIGPTTASAAKQAGFGETLLGEPGSVAALADLVESYVEKHCSNYCVASENRCSSGHERAKSSAAGHNQVEEDNVGQCRSRSRPMSEKSTEEVSLQRRKRISGAETDSGFPRKDACSSRGTRSGGNSAAEGSRGRESEVEAGTGNGKQDGTYDGMPASGGHPRQLCERKIRILVLLTRPEDRNDGVVQELRQRRGLLIQTVDLKHLISEDAQHRSYHQVTESHQLSKAPGEQKSKQQRHGTPVTVLKVPLLRIQATQGIFVREQRRLIAALLQLGDIQGGYSPCLSPRKEQI